MTVGPSQRSDPVVGGCSESDQQPPFVRGGFILAEGWMLMTDGNTKLCLVEPTPPDSIRSRAL